MENPRLNPETLKLAKKNDRLLKGIHTLQDEWLKNLILETFQSQNTLFRSLGDEKERLKLALDQTLGRKGRVGERLRDKTVTGPLLNKLRRILLTGKEIAELPHPIQQEILLHKGISCQNDFLLEKMEAFSFQYEPNPPSTSEEKVSADYFFKKPLPPLASHNKKENRIFQTETKVTSLISFLAIAQQKGIISPDLKTLILEALKKRNQRIKKRLETINQLKKFGVFLLTNVLGKNRLKFSPKPLYDQPADSCEIDFDVLPENMPITPPSSPKRLRKNLGKPSSSPKRLDETRAANTCEVDTSELNILGEPSSLDSNQAANTCEVDTSELDLSKDTLGEPSPSPQRLNDQPADSCEIDFDVLPENIFREDSSEFSPSPDSPTKLNPNDACVIPPETVEEILTRDRQRDK
ncbi:MAG: hypothetical protein V1746_00550 [bacterium]